MKQDTVQEQFNAEFADLVKRYFRYDIFENGISCFSILLNFSEMSFNLSFPWKLNGKISFEFGLPYEPNNNS